MNKKILLLMGLVFTSCVLAKNQTNHLYQAAMHQALGLIKQNHAYLADLNLDWRCIENTYSERAKTANNAQEILSAFEHLMLEFADNHMILNTNNKHSYRLHSPVVVKKKGGDFFIHDVWKNNLVQNNELKVDSQILSLNGQNPQQIIKAFPTTCLDKKSAKNQTWIINKALAGTYAKPRLLKTTAENSFKTTDLDKLETKTQTTVLSHQVQNNIGVITINNSLGNTDLIAAFDDALDQLMDTDGLVLDLRNTIGGGDSYMARAIISRLISRPQAYQKHQFQEQRGGAVGINRIWQEYVEPRGTTYQQPVVVLSNHWTGSMGEGLTIGLQGMQRATWIGSPMAGLLGAVNQFKLNGVWFSFQMPIEKLFSVDGTPRESAQPDVMLLPSSSSEDDILHQAIDFFKTLKPLTTSIYKRPLLDSGSLEKSV